MNFPPLKLFAFLFISASLTGCASLDGIAESPKAELDHVYVKDTNLIGTTAIFVLNVENPNKIPLKLDKVDYEVYLDNQSFSQSSVDQNLELPAQGKKTIEIPLPIPYAKLGTGVKKVLLGEDLDYRLAGHAHLSLLSIPFEKTGKLRLKDIKR